MGITNVYEKIKSIYSIELDTKQKALDFYKLLKAMFILATGAKEEYQFSVKIGQEGNIEIWQNNTKINYEELPNYIRLEYLDKIDKLKYEEKEQKELKRKLNKFKLIIEDMTEEYLLRQRQIATFLECKKTFFGKVKYFFKKKKDSQPLIKPIKQKEEEKPQKDESLEELYNLKQQYTIEDLINICTKLEEVKKNNTNLNFDINAMETKKEVLSKKIDNADLYIKEIDKHKKSIFEFWKFTSKDEVQTLSEADDIEEKEKTKLEKFFDYNSDMEELGNIIDELQRRKLSKNETDAIFALKQVPDSFKELEKEKDSDIEIYVEKTEEEIKKVKSRTKKTNPLEKDLKNLKQEYEDDIEIINSKDFDIFGNMIEDKTKVKEINNVKHREIEKDKYKVLNINLETDIKNYTENLEGYLSYIREALNKIKSPYNMSVYCKNNKKGIDGIHIFNMNPKEIINDEIKNKKDKIILCRLNIKENTPAIFYSNIIFYDNFNKTLPVGMNLSSEVLIDVNKIDIEFTKEINFYINYAVDEFEIGTKEIKVYEYNVKDVN